MFIIYGSRSTHLKTITSETAVCPHCASTGRLSISSIARYAHIFWIPLFSIGKKTLMYCTACQEEVKDRNMLAASQKVFNKLKEETNIPRWHFAGLIAIGIFGFMGFISILYSKKEDKKYAVEPIKGDVYSYHPTTDTYSEMKVVEVTEDSVFVIMSEKITTKMFDSSVENYAEKRFSMGKDAIERLYSEGVIYSIKRNKE